MEQRLPGDSHWRYALRLHGHGLPWGTLPDGGHWERLLPVTAPLERTSVYMGYAPRLPVWKTRIFLFHGIFLLTTLQQSTNVICRSLRPTPWLSAGQEITLQEEAFPFYTFSSLQPL